MVQPRNILRSTLATLLVGLAAVVHVGCRKSQSTSIPAVAPVFSAAAPSRAGETVTTQADNPADNSTAAGIHPSAGEAAKTPGTAPDQAGCLPPGTDVETLEVLLELRERWLGKSASSK